MDTDLVAVAAAERLLVGHLAGAPVRCEFAHDAEPPNAVTIVALDVVACEDHASGTLTP